MDPRIPGVFALGLTVVACGGRDGGSDSVGERTTKQGGTGFIGTVTTTGTMPDTTTVGTELFLAVQWQAGAGACADQVAIQIQDPMAVPEWTVGLVDTATADGWIGEDCFASPCHTVGAGTHVLEQVDDCEDTGFDGSSVVFGQTTAFGAASEDDLTWMFDDGGGFCFVFGHDVAYYAVLGCQEL